MKITLFLLCFLGATAALGQQSLAVAALNNEAQPLQMVSHPARAVQHAMAPEQSLLDSSAYVYAQGERPLWELAPVSRAIPLGDVARMLRQEHLTAKKADFVRND
jgi:outer membrane PBP1 activator LpoA protein